MSKPVPDLSVLTANDLLNAAVTQADDLADVAVTEAPGMGFADRRIAGFAGRLVPGGGGGELSLGIGHAKKCTENLTGEGIAYRFLYMETTTAQVNAYVQNLHQQADELDAKADALYLSLLAPSMKEDALRAEAKRLREMAR